MGVSHEISRLTWKMIGRTPEGVPIIDYREWSLELINGEGRDDGDPEGRELHLWLVPPARELALASLRALYDDRDFVPRDVCADVLDGKTRPLIDAFGDVLRTPEGVSSLLASLIDRPPRCAYVLRSRSSGRGTVYRVEIIGS